MPSTPNGPKGVVYRLDEALVSYGGKPHPGVSVFINIAAACVPNLGVVSMESPERTAQVIADLGLTKRVKQQRAKQFSETESDLYQSIAVDLGARPNRLIAVETSLSGVAAASDLGYCTIALVLDRYKISPGEFIEAGAWRTAEAHSAVISYLGRVVGDELLKLIEEPSRIKT